MPQVLHCQGTNDSHLWTHAAFAECAYRTYHLVFKFHTNPFSLAGLSVPLNCNHIFKNFVNPTPSIVLDVWWVLKNVL